MVDPAKAYKEVQTNLTSAFEANRKEPKNTKVYDIAIKNFEKLCQNQAKANDKDLSIGLYEIFINHSQKMLKAASSAPEESQLHLLEALRKMYEIAGGALRVNADRDLLGLYEALGVAYEASDDFENAAELYEKASYLHKKNSETLSAIIRMGVPDPKPLKNQAADYLEQSEEYQKLAKELRRRKKR